MQAGSNFKLLSSLKKKTCFLHPNFFFCYILFYQELCSGAIMPPTCHPQKRTAPSRSHTTMATGVIHISTAGVETFG